MSYPLPIQITATELSFLRHQMEMQMPDTCLHLVYTSERDSYGEETKTYLEGDVYPCFFYPGAGTENQGDFRQVTLQASIHLPFRVQSTIKNTDRLRILTRNGVAIQPTEIVDAQGNVIDAQPIDYEVAGDPVIQVTTIEVHGQRVGL